jgi:hypothetical protein
MPILTIGQFSPTSDFSVHWHIHLLVFTSQNTQVLAMTSPAALARIAAQVHITGTLMPKNLSESRLLLATLQKFGEVITYRNLKVSHPFQ